MFARHFLDRRLDRLGHPPIELVARVPDLNQSHAAVGRSRDVKRQAVGPILWPIDSLRDGVVVLGLEPVEFHDDSDGHRSPFHFGNAASVLIRDNAARLTNIPARAKNRSTDQVPAFEEMPHASAVCRAPARRGLLTSADTRWPSGRWRGPIRSGTG